MTDELIDLCVCKFCGSSKFIDVASFSDMGRSFLCTYCEKVTFISVQQLAKENRIK